MALNLKKGQKIDLTKGKAQLRNLLIGLGWKTNKYPGGIDFDLDVVAFLLGKDKKVRSNQDFVFYGNLEHTSKSVIHKGDNLVGGTGGDDEQIEIDLRKIPDDVERIAIAVSIYDGNKRHQNFGQVSDAYIRIVDTDTHTELSKYELDEDFSVETSLVVGEIYKYKGEWKFSAVGSGFSGGLETLCLNFGVDLKEKDLKRGAIILEKGRKINLSKSNGEISINLNWSQPKTNSYLSSQSIDLDLGCLYELQDGQIGAVQALGNSFGSLIFPPYIALDGDDRTGSSAEGETLRINSAMIPKIKRILVYTFIYEGIANWKEADGVVTIKVPGQRDIIVKMDEYGSNLGMCGIALLENRDGHSLSLEKVVEFFPSHEDLDRAFNWGLIWVVGTKD